MKQAVGVVLVVLCLAPACGSSRKTITETYLGTTLDTVVFVHWARTGDSVTGWAALTQSSLNTANALTSSRTKFRGVIHGRRVALTFGKTSSVLTTWKGRLGPYLLTLELRDSFGDDHTYRLHPASGAIYREVRASFRRRPFATSSRPT